MFLGSLSSAHLPSKRFLHTKRPSTKLPAYHGEGSRHNPHPHGQRQRYGRRSAPCVRDLTTVPRHLHAFGLFFVLFQPLSLSLLVQCCCNVRFLSRLSTVHPCTSSSPTLPYSTCLPAPPQPSSCTHCALSKFLPLIQVFPTDGPQATCSRPPRSSCYNTSAVPTSPHKVLDGPLVCHSIPHI